LKVKAGLAGFAQVYGKYNTTPYDKLKLDLIYIENYSVLLDLKLMMLTLKIIFWPDSTEGVDPGQTTAMKDLYMAMAENKYEDSVSYNDTKTAKGSDKDENTLDV
ncbi:MAG: sugar transferase, partial [Lachnospiraceae bacterium]|nr:sugar transferase [Lachnospiraceae bacterium]